MSRDYAQAAKLRRKLAEAKMRRDNEARLLDRAQRVGTKRQVFWHRHMLAKAQNRVQTLRSIKKLHSRFHAQPSKG